MMLLLRHAPHVLRHHAFFAMLDVMRAARAQICAQRGYAKSAMRYDAIMFT